ncbi:MAG: sigma 54-interacting transcriptional regulator [Deltaproteobacteria bacterium]|jgi:arginine utilization regulatory protein|nr:sigma 54-interacting transcriptional regulator [Deltaproteobacteria bacterium]
MSAPWPFKSLTLDLARNLYDRHHEGVLICDAQGRLVYYNGRMGELDGLEPGEALGRHLLEIYNLDEERCVSAACLKSGRPVVNEALYYRTRKGALVNAICNAYPLLEEGKLMGCVCHTAEYTSLVERLEKTARNYARHPHGRAAEAEPGRVPANGAAHSMASIVGESPLVKEAIATAKVSAMTASSVLIFGETGTGKELFAQAIHNYSPRRAGLFCPVNCAAIPENLLEGILFGTVKGAFTGALDREGLLELSHGGTVFLDELNAMPMGLQAKLLRAVQERRIRRLGGRGETEIDVKIIASLNLRPEEAVEKGLLRPDLFYRLGAFLIPLPPLRSRPGDVPELAKRFVKKYNREFQGRVKRVEPEFLDVLERYAWPGNARELERVIETAMCFAIADPLNSHSLGLRHIQASHLRKFSPDSPPGPDFRPLAGEISLGISPAPRAALPQALAGAEARAIDAALAAAGGVKSVAARALGISRQTLNYKLRKSAGRGEGRNG